MSHRDKSNGGWVEGLSTDRRKGGIGIQKFEKIFSLVLNLIIN